MILSNRQELDPAVKAMGYPVMALMVNRATPEKRETTRYWRKRPRRPPDLAVSLLSCSIIIPQTNSFSEKNWEIGMPLRSMVIVLPILRQLSWLKLVVNPF